MPLELLELLEHYHPALLLCETSGGMNSVLSCQTVETRRQRELASPRECFGKGHLGQVGLRVPSFRFLASPKERSMPAKKLGKSCRISGHIYLYIVVINSAYTISCASVPR